MPESVIPALPEFVSPSGPSQFTTLREQNFDQKGSLFCCLRKKSQWHTGC